MIFTYNQIQIQIQIQQETKKHTEMGVKLCDSCKTTSPTLFCKADNAFLCIACDGQVHAANKLASRHARIRVREQDAGSVGIPLPLARRRHECPAAFFFDCFSDEEAEAASWLLPINHEDEEDEADDHEIVTHEQPAAAPVVLSFDDIVVDTDQKPRRTYSATADPDGVVPVQNHDYHTPHAHAHGVVDGVPAAYDIDYGLSSNLPFMYNFTSQSITRNVEVGVVPEGSGDVSVSVYPSPVSGFDREARVLRYREKRKNRKFEKTIRYASRKAYAETRPRIKGRFAKRSEIDDETLVAPDTSYGLVPSC